MILQITKQSVQRVLNSLGYRMERIKPNSVSPHQTSPPSPLVEWLRSMNIKTVIDVGGHCGESALWYNKALPDARIYSFEPLQDCFSQLISNIKNIPNCQGFNFALGEDDGEQVIYRSSFTGSSSLLNMDTLHKTLYPFSADISTETVKVRSLDSIAEELSLEPNILLKMDVQGFEDRVLKGGQDALLSVKIVLSEVLFQPLYEEQANFADIYKCLLEKGFVFRGTWAGYEKRSPMNGLPVYCDALFLKE
ncbi:FkbM family methyltransferase [Cyanobacteria bacterium FACHB-472]|nr:FkbM family methyltransferase [Cyanobacteria bacterium FACHB-472]